MRLLLLSVTLGVVTAGCAGVDRVAAPPSTDWQLPTTVAPVPAGLDFPVDAAPRPIVLLAPKPVTVEWVGSGEEKLADGYRFTGVEPPTPAPRSVVLPGGPASFPLIGVSEAVAGMAAGAGRGEPLELVSVELGTAAFNTDRGELELPAWLFRSSFGSVYAWPALAPEAFWKQGEVVNASHDATTSDGVELEVELGAAETPCHPDETPSVKEPVVTEGESSVVIGVRTIGTVGDCARNAMYRPQYYPVKLSKPLGNRVVVFEEDGTIIPVTPR